MNFYQILSNFYANVIKNARIIKKDIKMTSINKGYKTNYNYSYSTSTKLYEVRLNNSHF